MSDYFLKLNEGNALTHAGKISHDTAFVHTEQEHGKFDQQRQSSNFDKVVKVLIDDGSNS